MVASSADNPIQYFKDFAVHPEKESLLHTFSYSLRNDHWKKTRIKSSGISQTGRRSQFFSIRVLMCCIPYNVVR